MRQHHVDGEGYPDGLAREAISVDARILAIADAYDAMISDRSHHAFVPLLDFSAQAMALPR